MYTRKVRLGRRVGRQVRDVTLGRVGDGIHAQHKTEDFTSKETGTGSTRKVKPIFS